MQLHRDFRNKSVINLTLRQDIHLDFRWDALKWSCFMLNWFVIFRHQGPAFDHGCCLRLWPQQSDQLYGARSDGCLPTHQIQRRLGCQAYLDPPVLHAVLCSWYWAEAGAASPFKERVIRDVLKNCLQSYQPLCVILMPYRVWL